MDIVAVTVWDEEEVSILDGEKLNPVICGSVVSDDEEVDEILVCLELLVEERLALRSLMRCYTPAWLRCRSAEGEEHTGPTPKYMRLRPSKTVPKGET